MRLDYNRIPEINDYIELVRHGDLPSCPEQFALLDKVERTLTEEDVRLDTEQLGAYLRLQQHFPFDLFPWEKFIFALRNCLYTPEGMLRFPDLLLLSGRGTGKNGYISYEAFANLTPAAKVKHYEIDIFATSEDQAKTSFNDVYEILEDDPNKYKRFFTWNKEVIRNRKTGNTLNYNTASAKTKDGYRPGSLYFDEYHAYETDALIEVATSGLGKVPFPKKGILTTDGRVRGGPLDSIKRRAEDILFKGADDLGLLPVIYRLPDIELVHDERNWHMANPSLRYLPDLLHEMRKEYASWMLDPLPTKDFIVKRMNIPPVIMENDVTSWENVLATNREMPDLTGCECVPAIDYSKTTDFVAAGLLFKKNDVYYWITHTWVCTRSPDLPRIKAPLKEWAERGLLTFVDAPEIAPEIPVDWLVEQLKRYTHQVYSMDSFRFTLLARALKNAGFDPNDKKRFLLTKRVTQMRWAPVIESAFATQRIVWGDNPLMRWYTNNACKVTDKQGNTTFEKKEEKSRKTDGFMALVHAFCGSENLTDSAESVPGGTFAVYSY